MAENRAMVTGMMMGFLLGIFANAVARLLLSPEQAFFVGPAAMGTCVFLGCLIGFAVRQARRRR